MDNISKESAKTFILVATIYEVKKVLLWTRYKFYGCSLHRIEATDSKEAVAISMCLVDRLSKCSRKHIYKISELINLRDINIHKDNIDVIPYKQQNEDKYYDYINCK